jgi:hypothetical protein
MSSRVAAGRMLNGGKRTRGDQKSGQSAIGHTMPFGQAPNLDVASASVLDARGIHEVLARGGSTGPGQSPSL